MSAAEREEWEQPIGLTAECAICLDDSDDADDSEDGKSIFIRDGGEVASTKCASSLASHESSRIGNGISSYFQRRSQLKNNVDKEASSAKSTNRVTVNSGSDGGGQSKQQHKNDKPTQDGRNDIVRAAAADVRDSPKITSSAISIRVDDDDSPTEPPINGSNPFASFAFSAGEASSSSSSLRPNKRPRENRITIKPIKPPDQQSRKKKKNALQLANKQQTHSLFSKNLSTKHSIDDTTGRALQSQQQTQSEMSEAKQKENIERQKLIAKWHAFADPNVPIEQRRFQVLIAARLHARCQEVVVKKAMDRLRKYFNEKEGVGSSVSRDDDLHGENQTPLKTIQQELAQSTIMQSQLQQKSMPPPPQGLTIHSLASSNPETEIAPLLSSVLFGNVKANHIVTAAQDVLTKFEGKVPESITSLKDITGIGPKLAEILNVVNKRKMYS